MHAHQKAVELRLGQWERTDLLLRVLRGDDEERLRQRHRLPVERHLPLFHGFEQCALRLGRCPVDLIGQNQLRKDGTVLKTELAGLAVVDRYTEYIGGQQIARELHPLEGQTQRSGEGVGEGGLADAGNILDQQVPARQQAGEAQANLRIFPQDHPIELREHCADLGSGAGARRAHRLRSALTRAVCAAN